MVLRINTAHLKSIINYLFPLAEEKELIYSTISDFKRSVFIYVYLLKVLLFFIFRN